MKGKDLLTGAAALGAAGLMSVPAAAAPADFAAKADAYLKSAYPADGPGVAAIVVDDGEVVYSGGQGMADIAGGDKITAATVFRLGSITKQFTSAVILQLAQEGKLSLSDPLSKFLPGYPKPGADATVAQLLNHTSGIKSYTGIPGWMASDKPATAFTTEQLVAEFKDLPTDFAAGTEHRYNNSGYVLLGAIIEKVTGKPWHVAVDERIARPLGLNTLRYGELEQSTPNMAVGYSERDGKQVPARPIHMSVPHAAGALIGTVGDLAKWAGALHGGTIVSPASYRQMIAPTKFADGKVENYGYGLAQAKLRGRDTIGHGGGIFGFDTASTYLPGEDLFVAVFANSDDAAIDPDTVMAKLAAMAVGDPFPEFQKAPIVASAVEPLLGVYKLDEGERRFFLKDGKLFTRRTGGSDQEVFYAGGNRYFYGPASMTWFEVEPDSAGKPVMSMHFANATEPEKAVWNGPVPPEAPVVAVARPILEAYVGDYRASQGIARVALDERDGMTIQLGGGQPRKLLATSETEFRPDGIDGKIVFHRGDSGVSHIVVHMGDNQIRADREAAAD